MLSPHATRVAAAKRSHLTLHPGTRYVPPPPPTRTCDRCRRPGLADKMVPARVGMVHLRCVW